MRPFLVNVSLGVTALNHGGLGSASANGSAKIPPTTKILCLTEEKTKPEKSRSQTAV
jgi:hypothetical protein